MQLNKEKAAGLGQALQPIKQSKTEEAEEPQEPTTQYEQVQVTKAHPSGLDHFCLIDYSRIDQIGLIRQKSNSLKTFLTDQTEQLISLSSDFLESERRVEQECYLNDVLIKL